MKSLVSMLLFCLLVTYLTACESNFCRTLNGKNICITHIKRSAKNYWEYRASVQIDGKVTPIELYDCRQRIRIPQEGQVKIFQPDGVGELICSFFDSR